MRKSLIILCLPFLLSACMPLKDSLHDSRPYALCSGFLSSQTCEAYSSKVTCNAALHACQRASNQIKPWQCGQCVPRAPKPANGGGVVGPSSESGQPVSQ